MPGGKLRNAQVAPMVNQWLSVGWPLRCSLQVSMGNQCFFTRGPLRFSVENQTEFKLAVIDHHWFSIEGGGFSFVIHNSFLLIPCQVPLLPPVWQNRGAWGLKFVDVAKGGCKWTGVNESSIDCQQTKSELFLEEKYLFPGGEIPISWRTHMSWRGHNLF